VCSSPLSEPSFVTECVQLCSDSKPLAILSRMVQGYSHKYHVDMSFDLFHEVAQDKDDWRLRIKGSGQPAKGQNSLLQVPGSKSVTSWRRQKSVVCVLCRATTSWQLPCLRGSYGETCLMDFGYDPGLP